MYMTDQRNAITKRVDSVFLSADTFDEEKILAILARALRSGRTSITLDCNEFQASFSLYRDYPQKRS